MISVPVLPTPALRDMQKDTQLLSKYINAKQIMNVALYVYGNIPLNNTLHIHVQKPDSECNNMYSDIMYMYAYAILCGFYTCNEQVMVPQMVCDAS